MYTHVQIHFSATLPSFCGPARHRKKNMTYKQSLAKCWCIFYVKLWIMTKKLSLTAALLTITYVALLPPMKSTNVVKKEGNEKKKEFKATKVSFII